MLLLIFNLAQFMARGILLKKTTLILLRTAAEICCFYIMLLLICNSTRGTEKTRGTRGEKMLNLPL